MTSTITLPATIERWNEWIVRHCEELVTHLVESIPFDLAIAESAIDHLTSRLACALVKDRGCSREDADRYVALGLNFLEEVANNPGQSFSPTPDADIGWHMLMIYTGEYAAVCQVLVGRYVHHIPNDIPGRQSEAKCFSCTDHHCENDDCRNGR
jgi:hypothetical protein